MEEKCTQAFRNLLVALCILYSLSLTLYAESENRLGIRLYGSFLYTETVPNALFFFSDIEKNDSFELRKALRNHDIDTLVLSSRGGSVWEGLSMAGIIHDKGLTTYVPKLGLEGRGDCASACSFMFFAGKTREAEGDVGVHQFYSGSASESAEVEETEEIAQFTVSEIIGFLNEFETPPFVFERMFQQSKMYYFDNSEMKKIARTVTPFTQENRSEIEGFINEFLIELAAFEEEEASEAEQPEKSPPPKQQPAKEEADTYTQVQIVKNIQIELNRLNCNAGVADGVIGNKTKSALARYATAAGKFIDESMLKDRSLLSELQKSQVTCNAITHKNLFGNLVCSDIIYGSGPEKITIYDISNPPSQKDQSYKIEICKKENSCKIETYQKSIKPPDNGYFTIMSGNERYWLVWNYGDENEIVKLRYLIVGNKNPGVELGNSPEGGWKTVLAETRYSKCTFSSNTIKTTTQKTYTTNPKSLSLTYKAEMCGTVEGKRECFPGKVNLQPLNNNEYEFEVNSSQDPRYEEGPLYGLLKITDKGVEYQMVEIIQGVTVTFNGVATIKKNTGEIIFSYTDEEVIETNKKAGVNLKVGEFTDVQMRWY